MTIKRKRGRPADPDAKRRRRMIGVRLCDETRGRLEADAASAGRLLSQEVEHRVERSIRNDEVMAELRAVRDMLARFLANGVGYGR